MAMIRIGRARGPSIWPWVVGLIILAALIWAIARRVNTDRDNRTMAVAGAEEAPAPSATAPGALAPSTSGAEPTPPPGAAAAAPATEQPGIGPLGALVPLGVQDAGQTVSAVGTVVSKPAHGGFWLRSDANAVIWVRSDQNVKSGDPLPEVVGRLTQPKPDEMAAWLKDSDVQTQAANDTDWQLTTDLYLDAGAGSRPGAAAESSRRYAVKAASPARARAPGRR